MRFDEIRQLQWKMIRSKREKGQNLVWCELPKEICKNRKYREFWSRGGNYLDRVKRYSRFTEKENYVFSHPKFDRPLARPTFYKYWQQLMEFSGFDTLDKKLSYYSLRHFGITARLIAGVPIYNVSEMAGTNVQFIEQHYEHLDMTKLRESAMQSVKYDEFGVVLSD